ncbi:hypothetical protein [Methylomonas koyamae]|uniref:hypothetical protein n=1 Tax=Methylomonas koyamae TaxID=702114 RepID=UPI0006D0A1F2|nr:hypothetical protein [Methylomonas koyamae]
MSGGVVGLTFNFAFADIAPDVRATIGDGSKINSTAGIKVLAGTDHNAKVEVFGLSVGGLAGGLSLARANLDAIVAARAGGEITADSLAIGAGHNVDPASMQAIHQVAGGGVRGAYATAEHRQSVLPRRKLVG